MALVRGSRSLKISASSNGFVDSRRPRRMVHCADPPLVEATALICTPAFLRGVSMQYALLSILE